jgi:hypothetical protein
MRNIRSAVALAKLTGMAAILLLASREAMDAGTFIKVIGARTRNNVSNSSITVSVPSSGVAAGNSIVVTVQVGTLGGALSCSDPSNGTYNTDVVSAPGGAGIAIASKHNVAALAFGDVLSCSYPLFNGAASMSAYEFSGLETVSTLDQTAQSGSSSDGAASSSLTAATAQAGELVFGFVWLPNTTQTFTPATFGSNPLENPYNPAWTQPFAAGTQKTMHRFVSAIRQYEANGTVGGAGGWLAQVATYRLAPDFCTGVDCDDGNGCTIDGCDPATGLCSHVPEPLGIHCGDPSSGICDSADRCDGTGVCLTNHAADGTPCGEVDSDCEIQETCLAGACHDNGVKSAGTPCGNHSATECDAPDTCDSAGFCLSNLAADGTACGGAGVECVNPDACFAGACHDNGFVAAGAPCGDPSSGQCDGADACDGAGTCSPNHVAGGTPCDDTEACTPSDACNGFGQCLGVADELCFACIGNTAPIVAPAVVASPSEPMALGSGFVSVTAFFADTAGQTRACTIDWGDGSAPDGGGVTEPTDTDPGSCTGSHLYTSVGVYAVSIAVADPCDESSGAVYQYAVVYDPNGGFVTGGGWIDSPAGAYTSNPALTGGAHFGFVSRYGKGNAVPTGRTDFHFSVANLSFSSAAYDWLVVSGAKARFRGTGQLNGAGRYGFALTALDGQAPGGGGVDIFRIRIWDQDQDDAVVYDNQIACPSQGDNADPCAALGGGAIVVHKK